MVDNDGSGGAGYNNNATINPFGDGKAAKTITDSIIN